MRVLLYADGGARRGLGHVMRTIALAEEAQRRGCDVQWCGVLDDAAVATLVRFGQRVDRVHRLQPADAEAGVLGLVDQIGVDVLHVDSYDLSEVSDRLTGQVLLSATQDHPSGVRRAHLIVDSNLGAESRLTAHPPEARWVLPGLDYAALRSSVRAARITRARRRDRRDRIKRVLVVMGGTDALGLTARVVEELKGVDRRLQVTAVAPADRHAEIRAAAGRHDLKAVPFAENLAGLAGDHDLVLTAAGTSLWELCHVGVPMAALCVVENQEPGYAAIVKAGAATGLGRSKDLGTGSVAAILADLIDRPNLAHKRASTASHLVDGLGAWRTVSAWQAASSRGMHHAAVSTGRPQHGVTLREATEGDAELLLDWRNDPSVRRWSLSSAEVALEDHRRWLAGSLQRSNCYLWLAVGPEPVGVVRWDERPMDHWEVSITLAPHTRGRGMAGPILAAAEQRLVDMLGRRPLLLATVHRDNPASRRLFHAAGYLPFAPEDERGFGTYAAWRQPVR